jgi:hypothetical protein
MFGTHIFVHVACPDILADTLAKSNSGWYDSVLRILGNVGQPGGRQCGIALTRPVHLVAASYIKRYAGISILSIDSLPMSPQNDSTPFPNVVY